MGGPLLRVLLFFILFLSSCISIPRSFHTLRYKDQKVYIDQHHYYHVGPLPPDWQRSAEKNPGIVFKNQKNRAKIVTEAVCGSAFEDLPLKALTRHLVEGLEEAQILKEEEWGLSQRKALYSEVKASLDGVPVALHLVVIKKNQCQFDLMSISSLESATAVANDFIPFAKGFDYQ